MMADVADSPPTDARSTAPLPADSTAPAPARQAPGAEADAGGPGALGTLALLGYLLGLTARYLYIFHWHPPMRYAFSDMAGYLGTAKDFCNPDFISGLGETVHPPGTRFFFGALMQCELWLHPQSEPTMYLAQLTQFVLCALVPPLMAWTARDLYGPRAAWAVLFAASAYYPLFDYSGYIMSEGPFLFTLVLSFFLLVRSLRTRGLPAAALGLAAGVVLGLAAAFKSVALPAALLVFLVLLAVARKHRLRLLRPLASALVGLALILAPLAMRGTRLSEGRFCLIANDAARNVLLGHYGNIGSMIFQDEKRGSIYEFGSPSAVQKGYRNKVTVPVGVYDNAGLMRIALDWMKEHPVDTVLLSFEHLFDLAFCTLPWPSCVVPGARGWVQLFHEIFLVLLLFPAAMYVCRYARGFARLEARHCGDLLVLMPLLAIACTAFISLGEPRYRIPFDPFIILLAMRAYVPWRGGEGWLEAQASA